MNTMDLSGKPCYVGCSDSSMVDEYLSCRIGFHLYQEGSDSSMVDEYKSTGSPFCVASGSDSSMVDEYKQLGRCNGTIRISSDSSMVDEYFSRRELCKVNG